MLSWAGAGQGASGYKSRRNGGALRNVGVGVLGGSNLKTRWGVNKEKERKAEHNT